MDEAPTMKTPVVLVFPVHKNGGPYCGLLIIPFDLYYVGYLRRDGVYMVFKKKNCSTREKQQVQKVIDYLKELDKNVQELNMGTSYHELEEFSGMTRQKIRLCRTRLMEALDYIANEHIDAETETPSPETGCHHLFITQGISEALRGTEVRHFFIGNFEVGKQTPPHLIISEHIWSLASKRLLLPFDKDVNFQLWFSLPLSYQKLHGCFDLVKKYGSTQFSTESDYTWYKVNDTAMYFCSIPEFRSLCTSFVKVSKCFISLYN